MKLLVNIAAILILAMQTAALAAPAVPEYSLDSSRIFWFLVVTDEHITARDSNGGDRLAWLLNDCLEIVEPDMVVNMGDLTDASKGEPLVSVYPGQQDDEWELYASIIAESGVTTDQYMDIPGNHDQYNDEGLDHYLEYSLCGSTFGETQHSAILEKPWGNYHFLGIDTAANDGAIWPLDNAGLDLGELVFIQNALDENQDARLTLMFGHHPILRPDLGFKLGEGSDEIQDLLGDFNVRAYFYGHTHEWRELYWPDNEYMPNTLHENVDSIGKHDEQNMLLASVDNDILQLRKVTTEEFPWVIVTTPANINQGGDNPWAADVPAGMEQAPVRALAFTTDPYMTCEYRLDDGAWHMMNLIGDHIYEGFMDTRGMAEGAHTVEVRAMPGPSTGHKITFNVTAYTCSNGIDDDEDGFTDFPEDPGCESVSDSDEFNEPVVVEEFVEQPDDDIIEPEDVIEDVLPQDAIPEDVLTEDAIPEDIAKTDGGDNKDVLSDLSSDLLSSDTGSDDLREQDQGGQNDDVSLMEILNDVNGNDDDTGNEIEVSGGCSSTSGKGSPLSLLLMVVVLAAFLTAGRKTAQKTKENI